MVHAGYSASASTLAMEEAILSPKSPLSKFCRQSFADQDGRLRTAVVHHLALVEEGKPCVRRGSRTSLVRTPSLENNKQQVASFDEYRRLTHEERRHNFERANDFFHKAKEINEQVDRTLPPKGSTVITRSDPVLRKASKESAQGSRRGSKDTPEVPDLQEPSEQVEKKEPSARAKLLAQIPKAKLSLLAMSTKALMDAGKPPTPEIDRPRQSSQIAGKMVLGRNTLLDRLQTRKTIE